MGGSGQPPMVPRQELRPLANYLGVGGWRQRCGENVGCPTSSLSLPLIPSLGCQGFCTREAPALRYRVLVRSPPHTCVASLGELGCSCWDLSGWSGSPWVLVGASLRGQPRDSVLPTWLLCSISGQPKDPCCTLAYGI